MRTRTEDDWARLVFAFLTAPTIRKAAGPRRHQSDYSPRGGLLRSAIAEPRPPGLHHVRSLCSGRSPNQRQCSMATPIKEHIHSPNSRYPKIRRSLINSHELPPDHFFSSPPHSTSNLVTHHSALTAVRRTKQVWRRPNPLPNAYWVLRATSPPGPVARGAADMAVWGPRCHRRRCPRWTSLPPIG